MFCSRQKPLILHDSLLRFPHKVNIPSLLPFLSQNKCCSSEWIRTCVFFPTLLIFGSGNQSPESRFLLRLFKGAKVVVDIVAPMVFFSLVALVVTKAGVVSLTYHLFKRNSSSASGDLWIGFFAAASLDFRIFPHVFYFYE